MKPGDVVELTTDEETVVGMLMPTPELEEDIIILKLESGYNVGFDKKRVTNMQLRESSKKTAQSTTKKVKVNEKLPTIAILHTGGTIASKVDYKTGGVIARFTPEELLESFPELHDFANVRSRLIRNMWSEDMRFAHYNIMAKEAAAEIEAGADGIIITHGTDSLHYTAAALAFIMNDLPVPVIIVGAQRSSDRGSTDASLNLIAAARVIAQTDFAGVAVCMHENAHDAACLLLPATKVRKMHTSRRDAFRPVNTNPIARVDEKISFMSEYKKRGGTLQLKLFKEDLKIGYVKLHTHMFAEVFKPYDSFDALFIEGFALGQMPINTIDEFTKENSEIKAALEKLAKKMPVAIGSQCIYGRMQMNVYQTGRDVQKMGVIGQGHDMTPETAFIKLAWLMSNHSAQETKDLFTQNLRGEITDRTEEHTFLI